MIKRIVGVFRIGNKQCLVVQKDFVERNCSQNQISQEGLERDFSLVSTMSEHNLEIYEAKK